MKTTLASTLALFGLLALGTAQAQSTHGHDHAHGHDQAQAQGHSYGDGHAHNAASGELPTVEAEVRRVNTRGNTVSLRHGPIPNLDMPPMSMTFKVSDPSLLEGLNTGDKVNVTIDQVEGEYTLMSVEPLQ